MDIEFGEYRLWRQQRQLSGPHGEIEIGGRCFDILLALLDHANSVVSKHNLLDWVWSGVAVEENTLQVHVVTLRKVLGPGMIATIHGRGYKYVGPVPVPMRDTSDATSIQDIDRRPMLVVLPFEDLCRDQTGGFLSHSISADIIDQLSKYRSLSVVGCTRLRETHWRSGGLGVFRHQLGADYLVAGNVRKSAAGIRIAARLTNVRTGITIWADHYDPVDEDDQASQDEIASGICNTLFNRIQSETATKGVSISPTGLTSHELTLQGMWHFKKLTRSSCTMAAGCFEEAISVNPDNAEAYRGLALCESNRWLYDFEWARLERCKAYAEHAVELDPHNAVCHAALGFCRLWLEGTDAAEQSYSKAFALNPGDPHVLAEMAILSAYQGRLTASREFASQLLRLDPLPPVWYSEFSGIADFISEEYEKCLRAFSSVPDGAWDVMYALSCLGLLGDVDRSRRLREKITLEARGWDFVAAARLEPFAALEPRARLIEGLERALSF